MVAIEGKRGCGFRKVGGLYLVADKLLSVDCHREVHLEVCPVCGAGIKPSRGWTWIEPLRLFGVCEEKDKDYMCHKFNCKICFPPEGKHGLLWIGRQFYKTPEEFIDEAMRMGVSRRIPTVPRGFKLGETVVYVAHRDAFGKDRAGIIAAFKPQRVEMIITETMAKDEEFMKELEKRGITPVVVPDDDTDHNPDGIITVEELKEKRKTIPQVSEKKKDKTIDEYLKKLKL